MTTDDRKRKMIDDAITISLLGCPEFRSRAGLPARAEGEGSTLEEMARATGLSTTRLFQIYKSALAKLRAALGNEDIS